MLYIQEKEGLCYLSSENKGADQLHGYQNPVFTCCCSSNIGLLHLNFAAKVFRIGTIINKIDLFYEGQWPPFLWHHYFKQINICQKIDPASSKRPLNEADDKNEAV